MIYVYNVFLQKQNTSFVVAARGGAAKEGGQAAGQYIYIYI